MKRARAGQITETVWQSHVLAYARQLGWSLRYHTRYSLGSTAGFPDLVLVRPPRLIFAELKSDTGQVSPAQDKWLEALSQVTQAPEVYLWRPFDRGAVLDILR